MQLPIGIQDFVTLRYTESLSRPVVKIGVRFNLEKKQITGWAIA